MSTPDTPAGRAGCKRGRANSVISISALLSSPATAPPPIFASSRSCAACLGSAADGRVCHACADGGFCRACLAAYACAAADDSSLLPLRCGQPECRAEIEVSGLERLVGHEVTIKLKKAMLERERVASRAKRLRRRLDGGRTAGIEDLAGKRVQRDGCDKPPKNACDGNTDNGEEEELDEDEVRVLELLESEGWQRCPDCGTGVERVVGCRHMSCVCGGQFCYSCGGRWGRNAVCARRCGFDGGFAQLLDGGGGADDPQGLWDGLRDQIWRRMLHILQELHGQANRQLGTTTRLGLADVAAVEERARFRGHNSSRGLSVQDLVHQDPEVEEACRGVPRLPRLARLGYALPPNFSSTSVSTSNTRSQTHPHDRRPHRSMKLSALVHHNLDFLVHERDQPLI